MNPFVVKFPYCNLVKKKDIVKIGNIDIDNPIILAPMAGVTDRPFRLICKELGASIVYTEFVSAEGIIRENIRTLDMISFKKEERPIGVQIFGDNPKSVSDSAKFIYENFQPDIIDINFGCPVPKVTKKGAGAAALKNLSHMEDVASSVVEKVPDIPVTVKMRTGWDSNNIISTKAGIMLEKIGIKAITLHGRTSKQSYSGNSNWELIKELKENVSIPVIGNGDVDSVDKYHKIKNYTQCDGVMIGRGALGNPWIFKQIRDSINNTSVTELTVNDILFQCLKHLNLLVEDKSEKVALNLSKKHINYYLKGFKDSSKYRKKIMGCENVIEIQNELKKMI